MVLSDYINFYVESQFFFFFRVFLLCFSSKMFNMGNDQEINGEDIVLTMIGLSNSNKTRYQVGCQSRTNACI